MKISNVLSRRNRILLRELIITDFKLRYQGSALGFFLGAACVKYRDVVYTGSELIAKILLLNPTTQTVQDARYNLVTHQTITTRGLTSSDLVTAIYFRKNSDYFAERI